MAARVAVLRTSPETVVADYGRLLRLAEYDRVLPRDGELLLKLNLSWTRFFPACSTPPWQLEGVVRTLLADGYRPERLHPVENKTVVTNPRAGAVNNRWLPVLARYGLPFIPLSEVEWTTYRFKSPLLRLNALFPEGIEIPKMFVGASVLHLPTMKCVHPDTEILLADGSLVRADALVKELQIREPAADLPDGDRVSEGEVKVVAVGEDGLRIGRASHFWRTPVGDDTVWTVTTRTGRRVTTSRRHPFLTPEGWKTPGELRVGDRIAVVRRVRIDGTSQSLPRVPTLGHTAIDVDRLPIRPGRKYTIEDQRRIVREYLDGASITEIARTRGVHWESIRSILHRYGIQSRWRRVWATAPERTSPAFWRWLGYFVAEGYAYEANGSYRLSLANTDPELRADYIELCRSLFSVSPRTRGNEIYFDALNLRPFFESLGFPVPTNSATKTAPDALFRCPDDEVAAFLQGYLDGDGGLGKDGLHAVTRSFRLAPQLQMLLARLGVVAFVGTVRCRATNGRMRESREYAQVSVYGDDIVALSRHVRFRCAHKQRALGALVARRLAGRRPSNWDRVPVPPPLFRMVRQGLGLTQESSGRPGSVNNVENRYTEPTRPIVQYFIELFSRLDTTGRFANEIAYLRFLASEDIAWDWIREIQETPADVPFLYDLSVEGTHSFVGNGIILHNTHGHTVTTGAVKNAFGGLLKEVRHYAHEFIHEVLVDLLYMQRELHPAVYGVMDGTVIGDGAGPRTMIPREGNLILASADSVALDATAARLMGYDPLGIPYLRMAHDRGLGVADPRQIELVGDDVGDVNFRCRTARSLVIWGDQLIRRGPLRPLKRLLLHSPLVVWAPFASNVYHDLLWYPTIGRSRIRAFSRTGWGRLLARY
jgi:intein/homing endonuclease